MIRETLPAVVAVADTAGAELDDANLYPGEEHAIARAVDKRRREYSAARACARLALADLGIPPVAILSGDGREPLWPTGVVGAITHCDDYRAAAVARAIDVVAIGIDAEPHDALPREVAGQITRPEEVDLLAELARAAPQIHWDRLLFSAKESAYKAWFPLTHRWLDFQDVLVTPGLNGDLVIRLLVPAPARLGPVLRGRWLTRHGLLLTAVTVMPAQRT